MRAQRRRSPGAEPTVGRAPKPIGSWKPKANAMVLAGVLLVVMTAVGMALGNVFEIYHYGSSL